MQGAMLIEIVLRDMQYLILRDKLFFFLTSQNEIYY